MRFAAPWGKVVGSLALAAAILANCGRCSSANEPFALNWPSRVLGPARGSESPGVVSAVALDPAAMRAASAGDDHLVRVWDLTTTGGGKTLAGHTDWVRTLAWSPDGRLLASAGNDRRILLWDLESGRWRLLAEHPQAVAEIAFSRDGRRLAAAGFESSLRIYDAATGELTQTLACPCRDMRAIAYSPDGALLAGAGRSGRIRIWSMASGETVHEYAPHRQRIRDLLFAPSGQELISVSEDRTVHVHSLVEESASYSLPDCGARLMAAAMYGEGKLAAAGSDNRIHLWDLEGKRPMGQLAGHTGTVAALAAAEGVIVSGGFDTTIRVWTVQDNIAAAEGGPAARVSEATSPAGDERR